MDHVPRLNLNQLELEDGGGYVVFPVRRAEMTAGGCKTEKAIVWAAVIG